MTESKLMLCEYFLTLLEIKMSKLKHTQYKFDDF